MVLLAVANENNLDIEFIVTNPAFDLTDDYLKLNPLGRVPTFVAADGWVLTEVVAIALYCKLDLLLLCSHMAMPLFMSNSTLRDASSDHHIDVFTVASQNKQTRLLGSTEREYAEIVKWMSFVNSEIQPSLANWFKPLLGLRTYDEKNLRAAHQTVNRAVAVLESHLFEHKRSYIVGDILTLADLFAASSLSRGFMYVFDRRWQENYPCVTRWFRNLVDQPIWRRVVPEPVIVETAIQRVE